MPITRTGLRGWLVLAATALFLIAASPSFAVDLTTIYVVRHADRNGDKDELKKPKGFERAEELARVLADANLTAILTTELVRTQQTAAPTIAASPTAEVIPYPSGQPDEVAKIILGKPAGGTFLVVGRSTTAHKIVAALGAGDVPKVKEGEYDWLFVVHVTSNGTHVHKLRYGERTP